MSFRFILVSFLLISSIRSYGQANDVAFYEEAYRYLNDSIVKQKLADARTLAQNCKSQVTGVKLKFSNELQVAGKFIEINHGFPFCDLLKKKYQIAESCVYALGSGKFELTDQVQDSLDIFWKDYQMKTEAEMLESLKSMVSNRKDGYQVFFSDVYKNTLAAELKGFCLPFDKIMWMGSSISFYFIFDDKGKIQEVYSESTIHYN